MTREEALRFLAEGARTGHLATATRSGSPHVAPVWFVVSDGDIVFTTGRDTVKGRHLRANPRAALTADDRTTPTRSSLSVDRSALTSTRPIY